MENLAVENECNKEISIIVPVYNEKRFIKECLCSIYAQDYPSNKIEVIVVDGHSTDNTVQIIRNNFPKVIVLYNPDKIVPVSMNLGIKQAKGDYIIRLDAHCKYPTNYVSRLIEAILFYRADNVGAVCRTLPANDSAKAKAISTALCSKFGMGDSSFRVGADKVKEVDTVPFGCFPRDLFDRIGYYDEELIRNQDDELNGRIIKNGGKIYLLPDLVVDYYSRDSIRKVYRMFYQYGLFKPLGNKKIGRPTTWRQFVPLLFVLSLIFGGVVSVFSFTFLIIYFTGIGVYLLADILSSYLYVKSVKEFLYLTIIFPVIHFAYGWGYVRGLIKIAFNRSFTAKINR